MKHQYFGDVNDYRKYGLIRTLHSSGFTRIAVAWMLTPNDGSQDGGFRRYLESPSNWSNYDNELYEGLQRLLADGQTRDLTRFEQASLLPGASFYSSLVPDSRNLRAEWHRGLLQASEGVDLVFLDPDNGIEVASCPVGKKKSSKYVAWEELRALWDRGCSLLIYQHLPRERRESFAARLASKLSVALGARHIEAFRTPHVLFLCVAQERHADALALASSRVKSRWLGQVTPMGLPDSFDLKPMNDNDIPCQPAVLEALVADTAALSFTMISEPKVGALLAVLAASKPGGRLLELGTGTGHGAAWLLQGMDDGSTLDTVDTDEQVVAVARRHLGADPRVTFHVRDGGEFLGEPREGFDLIYADAWPGKFSHLDEALALLRPGGIYVIDDLLPQPNWPEGHAPKVPVLIDEIERRAEYTTVRLAWASGLMLVVKRPPPSPPI